MIAISILEFLRTGYFGAVKIGMSGNEIIAILGPPDWHYPQEENTDYMAASYWTYGGVQLFFDGSSNLNKMSFKPSYFYQSNPTDIKVDPWIFEGGYKPTKQELTIALQEEGIEVKDTGVLLLIHYPIKKTGKFKYIRTESEMQPGDELVEEVGFLSLRSDMEVLYGGNRIEPLVHGQDGTNKVLQLGIAMGGYFTINNEPLENLRSSW